MLSSKNRLRKRKDINKVFQGSKTIAGDFVFVRAKKSQLKNSRFAFIVSTKISRKAVIRNKIKRQLRETIKQAQIKNGFDFIIIAKPTIINKTFTEIKKDINEIFSFKFSKIVSKECFKDFKSN